MGSGKSSREVIAVIQVGEEHDGLKTKSLRMEGLFKYRG